MLLVSLWMLWVLPAWANHSTLRVNPFNTIPINPSGQPSAGFGTDLRESLEHELPQHLAAYSTPFVSRTQACQHGTAAGLTSAAFACEAFVPEHVQQTATAITYAAVPNDVCWTILSSDNNGITGWTRVGSGNTGAYYYQCEGDTTPNQPDLPANSTWLMQVTITASSIAAVTSLRSFYPGGVDYAERFASFAAAIDEYNDASDPTITLIVRSRMYVTTNVTIPINIKVQVLFGGILDMASGTTLTVNGVLACENTRCLAGSGVATFPADGRTLVVSPYWWGALCNNSNDDTLALVAMFTAANAGPAIEIPGRCRTTASLNPNDSQLLYGKHRSTSELRLTSSTNSQNLLNASDRLTIKHLAFRVNGNDQRAIAVIDDSEVYFDDITITSDVAQNGVGVLCQSTVGDGSYSGRITNSEFTNLTAGVRLGLAADTIGCNAWQLSGNKYTSNNTGLLIDEANGISIIGGRFESNTAFGIDAGTGAGAVCSGVSLDGSIYFESNTTNHVRTGSMCTGWLFGNITIAGGSFSISSSNTLWHGQNQGTPGYAFAKDNWSIVSNQLSMAVVAAMARFNRMLIGGISAADASNTGLVDVTFSGNNPDGMTLYIFYTIYTPNSAIHSRESGLVIAAITQDNTNNIVSGITKVGGTQALDAATVAYTVTFAWSIGVNIATLVVNADANPNDTSTIHFTLWAMGGEQSNSNVGLSAGVTAGQ